MSWLGRLLGAVARPRTGPVGLEHAERLAAIHAQAFARPWSAHDFELFLLDRAILTDGLFLGRKPGRLAGFALSRVVLDEAEVLSVALARPTRGQGHSGLLLDRHIESLARAGVRSVHLEVEEGNLPALALYRRRGFRQSGVRLGYYARPDGTRAAALSMTRLIDDRMAAVAAVATLSR